MAIFVFLLVLQVIHEQSIKMVNSGTWVKYPDKLLCHITINSLVKVICFSRQLLNFRPELLGQDILAFPKSCYHSSRPLVLINTPFCCFKATYTIVTDRMFECLTSVVVAEINITASGVTFI